MTLAQRLAMKIKGGAKNDKIPRAIIHDKPQNKIKQYGDPGYSPVGKNVTKNK